MTNIYTVFASICIRRFPHHILRELITGLFVAAILALLAWIDPEWLVLFLWFYCYLMVLIATHKNAIFLNEHDLNVVQIHVGSLNFHVLYVIHYALRDMYWANLTCFSLLTISLSYLGKPIYCICLLVSYLVTLLTLPAQVFFASRLTSKARSAWFIILLLPLVLLPVLKTIGLSILSHNIYLITALLPLFGTLYCLIIYYIGHKIRVTFGTRYNARKWWSWLRPCSITLFKDILLQHQRILLALLSQLSLLILLSIGSNIHQAAFPLVIFAVCQTNIVMTRNRGKLYLITDDPQFLYTRFPQDHYHLLRGKLLTLVVNIPIILMVAASFLLFIRKFNLHDIALIALLLLTNFIIDATTLTESDRFIRTLRAIVKYLASTVMIVTWFMNAPDWISLAFLATTTLLYAPIMCSCYQFNQDNLKKGKRDQYELSRR